MSATKFRDTPEAGKFSSDPVKKAILWMVIVSTVVIALVVFMISISRPNTDNPIMAIGREIAAAKAEGAKKRAFALTTVDDLYSKPFILFAREKPDRSWVGIDIPDGWFFEEEYGNDAILDVRIYRGRDENVPPEEYILPKPRTDWGENVRRIEWRLNPRFSGYKRIEVTFTRYRKY